MGEFTRSGVIGARSNSRVFEDNEDTYRVELADGSFAELRFHTGSIENGPNGLTMEAVLDILWRRMERKKDQVFDGRTGGAQLHVFRALSQLQARTADRLQAGLEGSKQPSPGPVGKNGGR